MQEITGQGHTHNKHLFAQRHAKASAACPQAPQTVLHADAHPAAPEIASRVRGKHSGSMVAADRAGMTTRRAVHHTCTARQTARLGCIASTLQGRQVAGQASCRVGKPGIGMLQGTLGRQGGWHCLAISCVPRKFPRREDSTCPSVQPAPTCPKWPSSSGWKQSPRMIM